jgi:hypothetical protein
MLPRPALTGWHEEMASAMGKHQERHDHIWECYSIVFFDCGSSSRSQRPFFFSFFFFFFFFLFEFSVFLVGFSIDVDSPRSFLRWFVRLIVGRLDSNRKKKEPKEKPIKAADCSNVVQSIDSELVD